MYRSIILVFLFATLSAKADRVGDFDIDASITSKEKAQKVGYHKEKDQNLSYRVKIDCRGTSKYTDLVIKYIVIYHMPTHASSRERGEQIMAGSEKVASLAPLEKFFLNTKPVTNSYNEYSDLGSDKVTYGKATLNGISLRIMQGEKVIAEYSRPADTKNRWVDAPKED